MIAGKNPPRVADASTQKPERPHTVERLGILLVPDVLAKTPPFVDQVEPGSAAERAGLQPDDLILFVDGNVADSIEALREELSYIDRIDPVSLTVQRGDELLEIELKLTPTEAD